MPTTKTNKYEISFPVGFAWFCDPIFLPSASKSSPNWSGTPRISGQLDFKGLVSLKRYYHKAGHDVSKNHFKGNWPRNVLFTICIFGVLPMTLIW
ncbi:MAG: hypothetical protein ACFFCW_22955 [Candidatus Hodarchaeota archaeon]